LDLGFSDTLKGRWHVKINGQNLTHCDGVQGIYVCIIFFYFLFLHTHAHIHTYIHTHTHTHTHTGPVRLAVQLMQLGDSIADESYNASCNTARYVCNVLLMCS
jgi:hypothetical protein